MARIIYVNGSYRTYDDALVHVEDRGFQFADGVYEVCEIYNGKIVDLTGHLVRLERSLSELHIRSPMSRNALCAVIRETVRRNRVKNGFLYMQVTRGEARRDFYFPPEETVPSLILIARHGNQAKACAKAEAGIKVITLPDIRWKRPDIKSLLLLPQVLARQEALQAGASEAWLLDDDGYVTEGAASNAWIVTDEGVLLTRPSTDGILRGITRQTVLNISAKEGLKVEKRRFTVAEALAAKEAFVTAATALVMPVVGIDNHLVGNGKPGPVTQKLRHEFHAIAELWG